MLGFKAPPKRSAPIAHRWLGVALVYLSHGTSNYSRGGGMILYGHFSAGVNSTRGIFHSYLKNQRESSAPPILSAMAHCNDSLSRTPIPTKHTFLN